MLSDMIIDVVIDDLLESVAHTARAAFPGIELGVERREPPDSVDGDAEQLRIGRVDERIPFPLRRRLGAIRIVERKDRGLSYRVGGPHAGGVLLVAFNLGRAPRVTFNENTCPRSP